MPDMIQPKVMALPVRVSDGWSADGLDSVHDLGIIMTPLSHTDPVLPAATMNDVIQSPAGNGLLRPYQRGADAAWIHSRLICCLPNIGIGPVDSRRRLS
ncbi:MAG: hypothetical protein OXF74_00300 [Rhodobacteraceae bacterium]|nr:hypothetical protein [Paracoccaceae bacterium]